MDFFRFGASGLSDEIIDLIPGEPLIARDVIALADGTIIPEEGHKPLGEIGVVGEHPKRSSIAVNDDRQAPQHSVDDGVSVIEWQQGLIVGVARPHNCGGKLSAAISLYEEFFAGDFIARVFPERVVEDGGLGNGEGGRWGLVGAGGRDEDILRALSFEEIDIGLNVLGSKCNPIDYGVELVTRHCPFDTVLVSDIRY